ncbi:hypothetical protein MICA_483 [Micavibrio aeruginosavorus ARL-13]|uniref:Uncharacterized protein n=1 Tax=Micavibrio aeruginosavorus (strain ARL-13) TaxID=856793 RepID=G2KLJ0_MICAA|nr:hypothetical protein MICA_483 [Micavibrio aeruginosavorus ARL-13]
MIVLTRTKWRNSKIQNVIKTPPDWRPETPLKTPRADADSSMIFKGFTKHASRFAQVVDRKKPA